MAIRVLFVPLKYRNKQDGLKILADMNYIQKMSLLSQIESRKWVLKNYGPHAWINHKSGLHYNGHSFYRRKS